MKDKSSSSIAGDMEVIKSLPGYGQVKNFLSFKWPFEIRETLTNKSVIIAIGATFVTIGVSSYLYCRFVKFKSWKSQGIIGPEATYTYSDEKIIANSFLFFIDGLETTALALTFVSYFLARNPEIQETLYSKVKSSSLAQSAGSLNYEMLFELKYLDAVINETLRILGPVPMLIRSSSSDFTLSNGITVDAKRIVLIPLQAMPKNELYFPEPEKFDPSRFLSENKDQLDPGSFNPFSNGPRNCIGMRFALLELKLTIAEMILKYKFVPEPNTPEKIRLAFFRYDSNSVKLKVEKRT